MMNMNFKILNGNLKSSRTFLARKKIILSTAANPLHEGHFFLLHKTLEKYKYDPYIEISNNVDKTISKEELEKRGIIASQYGIPIILSDFSTFILKSQYENSIFPIGTDTAIRVCDPKYYGNSIDHMFWCLRQ